MWNPPQIWARESVCLIGGGPSLKSFDFARLRGRRVLAINEAFRDVPWADVLYFRDGDWFDRNRADLAGFAGLIVTTSPASHAAWPERVKLVAANTAAMPRARTSGHQAVSLALLMGPPEKIFLLGFDWNPEGGNYHDRHAKRGLYYKGGLIHSWSGYRDRARQLGCTIINATPASGIHEFPMAAFD